MSDHIERRLQTWTAPVVLGLIVGAVCCGTALETFRPLIQPPTSVAAVAAAPAPAGHPVVDAYRVFDVPIALVEPSSAATVITTRTELQWTTADGDTIAVLAEQQDDPFAPRPGTTVTDRGTRTVAGVTASVGTVLPRPGVHAAQLRVAELRIGDHPLRVVVSTSAADPDLRLLGDFEIVLDSLRALSR